VTIKIRSASLPDAPACFALDQRCFPPDIAFELEAFEELCETAPICLVAEENDQVIGMVAAEVDRPKKIGLIITLDVDPKYRRQGIGSQLMDRAEREMRRLGVETCLLHVYTPHKSAEAFYRQRGYQPLAHLPNYYRRGEDAILMAFMFENEKK